LQGRFISGFAHVSVKRWGYAFRRLLNRSFALIKIRFVFDRRRLCFYFEYPAAAAPVERAIRGGRNGNAVFFIFFKPRLAYGAGVAFTAPAVGRQVGVLPRIIFGKYQAVPHKALFAVVDRWGLFGISDTGENRFSWFVRTALFDTRSAYSRCKLLLSGGRCHKSLSAFAYGVSLRETPN
jgi:hypothetical protein